jgi:hypothetical protein
MFGGAHSLRQTQLNVESPFNVRASGGLRLIEGAMPTYLAAGRRLKCASTLFFKLRYKLLH